MKFVFATLQHVETDFYGRVGRGLLERGHEVSHLTFSRRSAANLRRQGDEAHCLPDLMGEVTPRGSWEEEERRIVDRYPIPDLEDVYRTDDHAGDTEAARRERTIRHFLAIETLFERLAPDVVVPEVGNETIRTVSHLVGSEGGATSLFLMYTIFDDGLRLYVDTMDAPIVPEDELRPLSAAEDAELDEFISRYSKRNQPIREHRSVRVNLSRLRLIGRHFVVRVVWDRDNDYLTPGAWLARDVREVSRARLARLLYETVPDRRYVYFPLHVLDDYKIRRLRPERADQEAVIRRIAAALPPGVDLVVKEHPMSIGRNPVSMLRRLRDTPNVRLVDPRVSSLDLIDGAEGVATISSTVGLEALLYAKPVLTLGRPFYSGYGVTVDLEDPAELDSGVPELLEFRPDPERTRMLLHASMRRCLPGAPVLVDRSDRNAEVLAETLNRAGETRSGAMA